MDLLVAKRSIKDHWSDWSQDFVPAPKFDVDSYQERLNTICGKSRGEPIMKLEWGGNASITKYTDWDLVGNPIKAEIVPRFALSRRHEFLDAEVRVPVRRWIISERQEEEQFRSDDNSDNTFINEYGVKCISGNKKDPGHKYLPYIYIGDHSKCPPNCCETKLCLGDYKPPTNAELDYLLEVTYKLQSEFYCDPYSPLNEGQLSKIRKESQDRKEKRLEAEEIAFDDESKEWLKIHGHRLEDYNFKKPQYIYKDGRPI